VQIDEALEGQSGFVVWVHPGPRPSTGRHREIHLTHAGGRIGVVEWTVIVLGEVSTVALERAERLYEEIDYDPTVDDLRDLTAELMSKQVHPFAKEGWSKVQD